MPGTSDVTAVFDIQNTCSCTLFDNDSGTFTDEPSSECFGDCWEDSLEFFKSVTEELRDSNETGWWKVENLRLWSGETSGYFKATKADEILLGMAVRGEWHMNACVYPDRIEYSLSHHDSPTGSNTTLRLVTEEEREEWGLR